MLLLEQTSIQCPKQSLKNIDLLVDFISIEEESVAYLIKRVILLPTRNLIIDSNSMVLAVKIALLVVEVIVI